MPDRKECPLCGGTMKMHRTETVVQLPGSVTAMTQINAEWVCPDCDYFEDVDAEGAETE